MSTRELDPAALRAFRDVAEAQLEFIEGEMIIGKMKTGNLLGNEPGFGLLDSSDSAREQYRAFHEQTWNNLQDLRKNLIGIINTLNASADLSDESEELNVQESSEIEDGLTG